MVENEHGGYGSSYPFASEPSAWAEEDPEQILVVLSVSEILHMVEWEPESTPGDFFSSREDESASAEIDAPNPGDHQEHLPVLSVPGSVHEAPSRSVSLSPVSPGHRTRTLLRAHGPVFRCGPGEKHRCLPAPPMRTSPRDKGGAFISGLGRRIRFLVGVPWFMLVYAISDFCMNRFRTWN